MALAARRRRGRQGIGFMGLLGLGEGPPRRVLGVRQHAVYARPEWCDKCGSRAILTDRTEARRVFCFSCGADAYWVARGEG